ncbi:hypothetical protein NRB56_25350 [Nocardia sp. RB56]|uniref:HTH tetR-type domain-containing protein n=1 Tax=Nocardia aurantia TaxID=2585199 RepID=A0A7K0DMI0_9NOCA|nr:hypothetical protein [Nocardia aurantia]
MPPSAGITRQLPRGRHGLSRETVVASQRERILGAMAAAMAENGYVGTSVATIIKRAGVSRETFYEQFRSREDCFEAGYQRAVEMMLARTGAARSRTGAADPQQRLDRLLRAYLDALADEPTYARLYLVEVYAVGSKAIARRVELQESFVEVIVDLLGANTSAQRFACTTLVAAISAMVTARVAAGDLDGLRGLREPILELVHRGGELFGIDTP